MTEIYGRVAKLHGEDVLRCHVEEIAPAFLKTAMGCFPKKLTASGVEAMVLDMGHTFLQLVPLSLGIPYVHISARRFHGSARSHRVIPDQVLQQLRNSTQLKPT
jgi:hypothetical protein